MADLWRSEELPVRRNSMRWQLVGILFVMTSAAAAQTEDGKPGNLDFEQGKPGAAVPGWFVPSVLAVDGCTFTIATDQPKDGKQCGLLTRTGTKAELFANAMQSIDA